MWRRYVTELLQPRNSVPSRTEKLEPARSLQNDCLGIADHRQILRFRPSTSATRVPGKVGRYLYIFPTDRELAHAAQSPRSELVLMQPSAEQHTANMSAVDDAELVCMARSCR